MRRILSAITLLLLLFSSEASAQITLVKNGKAKARIVCTDNNDTNLQAANLLNHFIELISGTTLPIVQGTPTYKNAIILGEQTTKASHDGFEFATTNGSLHIKNGGHKGTIYGVVTLLEKYLGVNYWAKDSYSINKQPSITIPEINYAESPAFRYRQTFSYGNEDPIYKLWFRLDEPNEVFINNMWVHTFNQILPAKRFGKAHPEWYSFINGKRQPGDHSQWCLTNNEVFEAVCHQLDSIFKANPNLKTISISQNDGNNTNCQCHECKAVDEYEGSPSGNIIRFLNKLATRYPSKQFSTLAYLFSMTPPLHTKPLPNVNIMLCDIDCKREVPLTDNESGQWFTQALEGWGRISDNIFVWDYGINFDNTVSPFPNFHILKKNLQLFKKNHATMVFEQVNGHRGVDFSEMRAYMLGKLMWNPNLDSDSLMQTFLHGYYGAAAPFLYQYHKIMEGALLASGTPLWIYDSPISHKNGMLNKHLRKTYNELFDKAEAAVSNDSTLTRRVRMARLPLQYSELEIARTETTGNKTNIVKKLNLFESRTTEYNIPSLNERENRPSEYCKLYRQRFLPTAETNKAAGAKITWNIKPAERYQPIADKALTDGLYGGTTYVESWVGWNGIDADFILDLGSTKEINSISTDFLHQLGAWILLPKGGYYATSLDGKKYEPFGKYEFAEDRDLSVKFVEGKASVIKPVKARYIKVHVNTLGNCPSWHYGVGYPAWFFMDEIVVL